MMFSVQECVTKWGTECRSEWNEDRCEIHSARTHLVIRILVGICLRFVHVDCGTNPTRVVHAVSFSTSSVKFMFTFHIANSSESATNAVFGNASAHMMWFL